MDNSLFQEAYTQLNTAQKEAVDTIDGPVLVIAGPGTGKTQLLSARVANILQKTDTPAQTILCLTFTENGANNMRERLSRFIGQASYDVTISTYHSFGSDIIQRFPQYFTTTRLQSPIDDLGKRQILSDIVERMSYANPLKQTRHHLGDLMSTISEVKRALLDSEQLQAITKETDAFLKNANNDIAEIFDGMVRMPRKLADAQPMFEKTLKILNSNVPTQPASNRFGSLAAAAHASLQRALDDAIADNSCKSLTTWKNQWLVKDADNKFQLDGKLANDRMHALCQVLDEYHASLAKQGLYDYDDMILRAIEALEQNDDLRFTLQEQYLYILLDEFQDTNAAQLRLIELLTNNPVTEGRPNVMAVGDDDQAIYAFQGAEYSNMLDFSKLYRDVKVINLTENYRSHPDILHTAHNIAEQIDSRLTTHFDNISKNLVAQNQDISAAVIHRQEFLSDISQNDWVACKIKELVDAGTSPNEIAVLAPKHKLLEPLIPYLNAQNIPVRYEKREDILQAPVVRQLITMSQLVMALHNREDARASALWPEVLSFEFWNIPISQIWKLSWEINDTSKDGNSWSRALLEASPEFRVPALLLLGLAHRVTTDTHETILDYLMGSAVLDTQETDYPNVTSPLRDYYLSSENQRDKPQLFYETLSHLTVLRSKLREYQAAGDAALTLDDMLAYIDLYQAAEEQMLNTSPYAQAADAVQMMTVFKAKGLEFEHVFLLSVQDEVWGSTSRSNSNKLTVPANLQPIRHGGATEDERLRILFVAITRAKQGLYLTSTTQSYAGKATKRLKYLDERETESGSFQSHVLPEQFQQVIANDHDAPAQKLLELNWQSKHMEGLQNQQLRSLLQTRLNQYQLSPTHLNTFLDLVYAGPQAFFFSTLLRFPRAPTVDSQFGNAIHETLQWVQEEVNRSSTMPTISKAVAYFSDRMRVSRLTATQIKLEIERGTEALSSYLSARSTIFKPGDIAEMNFRNEAVFLGNVHLGGKVDRLEIDKQAKTITVVDYKTGKGFNRWVSDAKLHAYKRQLYCYKLLIENSRTYTGYTVTSGRLEFVEPSNANRIDTLELHFQDNELAETRQLIESLWQHVHDLNFPDVSQYAATLTGIKAFEQDLRDGKI